MSRPRPLRRGSTIIESTLVMTGWMAAMSVGTRRAVTAPLEPVAVRAVPSPRDVPPKCQFEGENDWGVVPCSTKLGDVPLLAAAVTLPATFRMPRPPRRPSTFTLSAAVWVTEPPLVVTPTWNDELAPEAHTGLAASAPVADPPVITMGRLPVIAATSGMLMLSVGVTVRLTRAVDTPGSPEATMKITGDPLTERRQR